MTKQIGYYKADWYIMDIDGKYNNACISHTESQLRYTVATVFVDGADNAVKFAGALPTLTAAISGVLSVMQMSGKLKNGAGKVNMPSYICCV